VQQPLQPAGLRRRLVGGGGGGGGGCGRSGRRGPVKADLTDDADEQVVDAVVEDRRDADELARPPPAQLLRFCTTTGNRQQRAAAVMAWNGRIAAATYLTTVARAPIFPK